MNYFSEPRKQCPVCLSHNCQISANNEGPFEDNFYLQILRNDLNLSEAEFQASSKILECLDCSTVFCDPWLNYATASKMFNVIYGQHNRGWDALYAWLRGESIQEFTAVFNAAIQHIGEFRSYAEYNCPFQGVLSKLRESELGDTDRVELYEASRDYLLSRQQDRSLATDIQLKSQQMKRRSAAALEQLSKLGAGINKSDVSRYLLYEASSLCWGNGCIGEGVNCKSLADILFDTGVLTIDEAIRQHLKLDLIGIYNTLDHLGDPLSSLKKLLQVANHVLVINHAQPVISRQHLFVLQPGLLDYLRESGFNVTDFSNQFELKTTEINKDKLMFLVSQAD
jgi:hypothetical protein